MNRELIQQLTTSLNALIQVIPEAKIEFWYARDLMGQMGYDRWENFQRVVEKAMIACQTTEEKVSDHFREVTKLVPIGSGADRPFCRSIMI
ncbi:MAG: hypothetical protein A2527_07205 [Candidatus Lambdaproteobacteria bacterium RIFOXYD2_FULL_50_16]|uniref:Bro-N domain-containing protein n=1 Tax=Candidatus Lambdaproteobacteria bacterium RIFOXYD2_FULL_50_16 TaxID=1817772 RepID=A0A1F6GBK6_9PROT|nr:MAG: hypothetical protein A2527_07205 [Candidatus Lambdaproteobacteria bacterium RIFOXYD2_FULL_50_16]